jgi:hypothetical protein
VTPRAITGLCTAAFIAALGLLHLLLPDLAWRWRARRDLDDTTRPAVRLLGAGLLALAALVTAAAFTLL